MRRIFTSTIFVAALAVVSFTSIAQCTFSTTAPSPAPGPSYSFNGSSLDGFSGNITNASNGFLTTSPSGAGTKTITTPIFYIYSGTSQIVIRMDLRKNSSANITGYSITATTNANPSIAVCSATGLNISPSTFTTYYFTIPTTDIPSGVNFQLNITFTLSSSSFDIDNVGSSATPANGSLPVKFQSLDARPVNSSVALKWNVATEENLNGYSIERSNDGRNYSQIAFVGANGQSDYSFVDSKPTATAYYRIKSVDVNGRYGYSTVALVKSGKSTIVLKAFPSPVIKSVSIQHPTATAGTTISVSSADGRIMKTIVPAAGMQQTEIDLSAAKAGLYLVRFNSGNGESETLKILKQ